MPEKIIMAKIVQWYLIADIRDVKENESILISKDGGNTGIEYLVLKINSENITVMPGTETLEDGTNKLIPQANIELSIDQDFFSSCYVRK